MAKFKKKPVVIEAEQYRGPESVFWTGPSTEFPRLPDGATWQAHPKVAEVFHPYCHTLEGDMLVSPGDWVITGIKGEKYPCKPDIFAATYEAAK